MSVQRMMVDAVNPDEKWLYRVGGISALVLGLAYIATIALYVPVGAPPSGAEARLTYLAGKRTVWWAILAISVLTDFLFVPVANYPSAVLESSLLGVYAILVPAVGILMTSVVMLKGVFTKTTAYLGLVSGILGIVSVAGPFLVRSLGAAVIMSSVITTVWVLLVGSRLYRLGQ